MKGRGFADAEEWRRDHVAFWNEVTDLVRADAGDPVVAIRAGAGCRVAQRGR